MSGSGDSLAAAEIAEDVTDRDETAAAVADDIQKAFGAFTRITPMPGDHIEHTAKMLVSHAPAEAVFNGVRVYALPGDDAHAVVTRFHMDFDLMAKRDNV